jgi:hypothetical protein
MEIVEVLVHHPRIPLLYLRTDRGNIVFNSVFWANNFA